MPSPNTFDVVMDWANAYAWTDESTIVLLCNFVDQLHARYPGTEDDGIIGDFDRYLEKQARSENDASDEEPIVEVFLNANRTEFIEYVHPDKINTNLLNEDELAEYDQDDAKLERWRRAVDTDETTQGLDEWEG